MYLQTKKSNNCNCNYILFTKLPWPGDSEKTFRSSSQAATCPPVYHTRVPLAERDFLCDQRSDRRLVIAELDKAATILNKKRNKRRLEKAIIYLCVVKLSATPAKQ